MSVHLLQCKFLVGQLRSPTYRLMMVGRENHARDLSHPPSSPSPFHGERETGGEVSTYFFQGGLQQLGSGAGPLLYR